MGQQLEFIPAPSKTGSGNIGQQIHHKNAHGHDACQPAKGHGSIGLLPIASIGKAKRIATAAVRVAVLHDQTQEPDQQQRKEALRNGGHKWAPPSWMGAAKERGKEPCTCHIVKVAHYGLVHGEGAGKIAGDHKNDQGHAQPASDKGCGHREVLLWRIGDIAQDRACMLPAHSNGRRVRRPGIEESQPDNQRDDRAGDRPGRTLGLLPIDSSGLKAHKGEAMTGTLKSIDAAGAMAAMHSTRIVEKRCAFGRSVSTEISISPAVCAATCLLDSDVVIGEIPP
jgi:hypothetical protein